MHILLRAFLTFSLSAGPAVEGVLAQEEEEAPPRPWTNSADLALVFTTGNSSISTISVSDKFIYNWSRSRITLDGSALKTRTEERELGNVGGEIQVDKRSRTTAEEYAASARYRYRFYEGLFAFSSAGWQRNELAGIENRYTVAAGLGYQIIDDERTKLSAELGADWTREDPVALDADDFAGGQVRTTVQRQITDVATLDSEIELLENFEDTDDLRVNWLTALTASLSKVFAVKLSYLIRFDNQPVTELVPPETPGDPDATFTFDETDTRFAASLVVNF